MPKQQKPKQKEISSLVREFYPKLAPKGEKQSRLPYFEEGLGGLAYSSSPRKTVMYSYSSKSPHEAYALAKSIGTYAKKIFEAPALLGRSFFSLWEFTHRRLSFGFSPMDRRMDIYNAGAGGGPTMTTIQNMELAAMKAMEILLESRYHKKHEYSQ
jgi:hypothetical protein